ncbi:MAG: HNH endonuclease [Desulfobacterales bacterium]|nr:HNH endonuclease [Desulfobacterales bacterium]
MTFVPTTHQNNAITELQQKVGFNQLTAIVWTRAYGRCEYCKQDLLKNRLGYATGHIDHLLPKSKYPQYKDEIDNLVLSCSSCNGVKSNYDPIHPSENEHQMLLNYRHELIDRVRQYLRDQFRQYDRDWRIVLEILSDIWWEKENVI